MFPKEHVLFGALFTIIVFRFIPSIDFFGASIIFLASFLIDVDHYFYYIFKKKDFSAGSIINAFDWHVKNIGCGMKLHIFHTIEFLLVLGIISIFNKFFLYIFLAFIFHMILDTIYIIWIHEYSDRYLFFTSWLINKMK